MVNSPVHGALKRRENRQKKKYGMLLHKKKDGVYVLEEYILRIVLGK